MKTLELGTKLRQHFKTPAQFFEADLKELQALEGIGKQTASIILDVREYCRDLYEIKNFPNYFVHCPEDAANFLMNKMRFLSQEHLVCLFLNTKQKVIYEKTIFIGSLNASIIHPREIFKEAVRISASSIVVAHNHPSGDPTPSREDIDVTKRLVECGKIMGIEVMDHVVIGDKKYVGIKEKGYL